MSTQKSKTENTSKFSIVRAIAEMLKLGDQGKLDSFLTRVVKTLTKEISIHSKNLETLKFNFTHEKEELNDRLEDAEAALENAYLQIPVEKVGTNAEQAEFVDVYLENIEDHERKVDLIKKQIEKATEVYEVRKKETEKAITSLESRIKIISAS